MTRDEFVEQLEVYLKHIRDAYGYFDAYEAIITGCYNNLNEINMAPGFFKIVQCSLYNSLFMELAKLYCKRKNSSERTVSKLLNLVIENRHLFKPEDNICELIKNAEYQLESEDMKKAIDVLKNRRDQYMAHNDQIYFKKDFNPRKEFPIGQGELWGLISFADNLCKSIYSCLEQQDIYTRAKNSGDLYKLLEKAHGNT